MFSNVDSIGLPKNEIEVFTKVQVLLVSAVSLSKLPAILPVSLCMAVISSQTYVVGSKSFRPDIQKPRQMVDAVRDI